MTAEEKLEHLYNLKKEAEEMAERVRELEAAATDPKAVVITGMPSGSDGQNHADDKIIRYMDFMNMYADKMVTLWEQIESVEQMIDQLDPLERRILRMRYVDGMDYYDIADKVNYSIQHLYLIRARAIEKLEDKSK